MIVLVSVGPGFLSMPCITKIVCMFMCRPSRNHCELVRANASSGSCFVACLFGMVEGWVGSVCLGCVKIGSGCVKIGGLVSSGWSRIVGCLTTAAVPRGGDGRPAAGTSQEAGRGRESRRAHSGGGATARATAIAVGRAADGAGERTVGIYQNALAMEIVRRRTSSEHNSNNI